MTWREESALPGTKSCFLNPHDNIHQYPLICLHSECSLDRFESVKLPCDQLSQESWHRWPLPSRF